MAENRNRGGRPTSPTRRFHTSVTVPESWRGPLKVLCPDPALPVAAQVGWACEWGLSALRAGMFAAWLDLTAEERRAVIGAANGWLFSPGPPVTGSDLGAEIHDFFAIGEGAAWGWSAEQIRCLAAKVTPWGADRVMGILVWARAFWRNTGQNLDAFLEANPADLFAAKEVEK